MKLKNVVATLCLFVCVLLSAATNAQTVNVSSIVPDSVDIWGPQLNVDMGQGQIVGIRIRVNKHFGTTCKFDVELENKTTLKMTAVMGFLGRTGQLHEATAGSVSLKPGYKAYWEREKREVLKKGVKNDALICKNCNPTLGFLNLKFK